MYVSLSLLQGVGSYPSGVWSVCVCVCVNLSSPLAANMRLSSASGCWTRAPRFYLCSASLTLALFQVSLLLWGQMAQAAFEQSHFLQTMMEHMLSRSNAGGSAVGPSMAALGRYTPKKKNLKPHKLMRRLRKDWDPFWMSAERPPDFGDTLVKNAAMDPTLQQAVSQLNLSLPGPDGVPRAMEEPLRQALGAWLMQRATCRVHYVWDDLGVLYWPRWVRRGFCRAADAPVPPSSSSAAYSSAFPPAASVSASVSASSSANSEVPSLADSCSWPPGMHCVPAQSRPIRILLWKCQPAEEYNRWKRRLIHALQPPPMDDDQTAGGPTAEGVNTAPNSSHSARSSGRGLFPKGGGSLGEGTPPAEAGRSPRSGHALRAGPRPAGFQNEVNRRLKRETRFKVGGGAVVKNHTTRDVIARKRKEEDAEEETNETENWIRKTLPERPKFSLHCKWRKTRYPVTDDCFCSC